MSISTVTTDDLRRMNGKEGLILQGCGGNPQEWLDGINSLLTDDGILKNGSKFENISVFQNGELTNILFPFEDSVEIDMGKLAMWRLRSHEQFGGTWLSDYVPNRLGGFITEHEPDKTKPDCRLIGEDGNIFNLMGLAARTLRHNGLAEQATEMTGRIHECGNYDEALCIIGEYVNIRVKRNRTQGVQRKPTGTSTAVAKQGIQICEKYGDSRGDEAESADR